MSSSVDVSSRQLFWQSTNSSFGIVELHGFSCSPNWHPQLSRMKDSTWNFLKYRLPSTQMQSHLRLHSLLCRFHLPMNTCYLSYIFLFFLLVFIWSSNVIIHHSRSEFSWHHLKKSNSLPRIPCLQYFEILMAIQERDKTVTCHYDNFCVCVSIWPSKPGSVKSR